MGTATAIEWCDHTFNPWIGCSRVHTGCLHCYAEADFDKRRHVAEWGQHGTRVLTTRANWQKPIGWNKAAAAEGVRRRVFCASLADVFEDWTGPIQSRNTWLSPDLQRASAGPHNRATLDDVRRELFHLIDSTPWLDWLLLTKRPQNVRRMWPSLKRCQDCNSEQIRVRRVSGIHETVCDDCGSIGSYDHRKNVWLGTSISDQETAEEAIPELLQCLDLAPIRFVSAEPLVRRIILRKFLPVDPNNFDPEFRTGLDWLIIGGESGPKSRPCNVEWIRDLIQQCRSANVPVFNKQLGRLVQDGLFTARGQSYPTEPHYMPLRDKKGGDPQEWPEDLRVRQFPEVIR